MMSMLVFETKSMKKYKRRCIKECPMLMLTRYQLKHRDHC